MIVTLRTPLGDIVAKQPRAGAVFERLQIDYCCQGNLALGVACDGVKADPEVVLQQFRRAVAEAIDERDWTQAPLRDLANHIVSAHHAWLRRRAAAVASSLEKLPEGGDGVSGSCREALASRLNRFREPLEPHLRLEERRVFPAIARAEQLHRARRPIAPGADMRLKDGLPPLVREHCAIDETMRDLRREAARILGAHPAASTLLQDLTAIESDLHRHLHLEINILFPRAMALEDAYA